MVLGIVSFWVFILTFFLPVVYCVIDISSLFEVHGFGHVPNDIEIM